MGDRSWRFDALERKYVEEVLGSGFVASTSGSMNTRLEEAFAKRFGREFAITMNSGTTTLHASLWGLGVGYGDEVLVPAVTVVSCMSAIVHCNAVPVFVDVDPESFLMCPDDLERKISSRTRAIMPVHLYGQVCDMTRICQIASKYDLPILEDCAECFLGEHRGSIEGSFGQVASWSFENSKHLTCGDGGIITTDDEKLADRIRKLSTQGFRNATARSGKIRASKDLFQNPAYKRHSTYGFMYRLPEIAAAVALAQVEKIDAFVARRKKMGAMFEAVVDSDGSGLVAYQKRPNGDASSYWCFTTKLNTDVVDWRDFRDQHIKNGGDPIYACWALLYQEDSVNEIIGIQKAMGLEPMNVTDGICPNAELVQPQIQQFPTNQNSSYEMEEQAEALSKTLRHYS